MRDINATVIVDLKSSLDEIQKKLHKDARWGINRAIKEGLKVEISTGDEDFEKFYDIYRKTMDFGCVEANSLEELKKNIDILFVCKKGEKMIAGSALWFTSEYSKEIPRLYVNASDRDSLALQPNNLLYWHCIQWCKEKGYEKFDLGGWQINPRGHLIGINKFKEKWGEVIHYMKKYSLPKALGRKLIRNSDFFWKLNNKLKNRKSFT